jgi:hypothetical protein
MAELSPLPFSAVAAMFPQNWLPNGDPAKFA